MEEKIKIVSLRDSVALYVEDSQTIRESTAEVLGSLFRKVIVAENGQDGLDKFEKFKDLFDIVITDIRMPELSGLEMSEKIREINKSIPIVITSAFNDTENLLDAINLKIGYYAVKPINFVGLTAKLEELISDYKDLKHLQKERDQLSKYKDAQEDMNNKLQRRAGVAKDIIGDLESLLDLHVARIKCNSAAKVTSVTTKFLELFDTTKEAIVGEHIKEIIFNKEDQTKIKDALRQCGRARREQTIHLHLNDLDYNATISMPNISNKDLNFYEVLIEEA